MAYLHMFKGKAYKGLRILNTLRALKRGPRALLARILRVMLARWFWKWILRRIR